MINRTKLEHILEYARQQKRFGQHCKIPPGDMVEIVEIAMRKAGNPPVTPDGYADMLQRWLVFGIGMLKAGSQLPRNLIAETKAMVAALQQEDE
ncbi:Uncharacterised protein [Escherichia coli]|nr:Uncharacterised protein [Escherichia coli]VWM80909.1 Uncharacterised protein [Escherichia coli]